MNFTSRYSRSPNPKCPKCGSIFITIIGADYERETLKLKCINCDHEFEVVYDVWM